MKKFLVLFISILLFNCSSDDANDEECAELHAQYIKALNYTGGSQAALDQVTQQYNERKKRAGCN
ncbi:hypothetical protein ES711_07185 [Gelidibacter salicanalis]|uniref:Lipoprotein n=1 Tax=Gelidibacter salicanalis TaxID=291193 RepID=A0A5C7AHK1_9FLAO|nr:hypothetical protein [Gelidibacter salicanalis]TXE08286.1 hypothetical protein ES711_07185 [Gelidibacter salicanalis]